MILHNFICHSRTVTLCRCNIFYFSTHTNQHTWHNPANYLISIFFYKFSINPLCSFKCEFIKHKIMRKCIKNLNIIHFSSRQRSLASHTTPHITIKFFNKNVCIYFVRTKKIGTRIFIKSI